MLPRGWDPETKVYAPGVAISNSSRSLMRQQAQVDADQGMPVLWICGESGSFQVLPRREVIDQALTWLEERGNEWLPPMI